jgi:uncharacterized UPF0160 family protein
MFFKKPLIVTHNAHFHPDDVCAVAVLHIVLDGKYRLIRTRDESVVARADYALDIGGVYDASKKRFDHHQRGGAGSRATGIPYATFGLVWREYGEKLCGSKSVADEIDDKLVSAIDAMDNGLEIVKLMHEHTLPYYFSDFIFDWNPGYGEKSDFDGCFRKALGFAVIMLEREIERSTANAVGRKFVEEAYQKSTDKKIIVIDSDYPWSKVLMSHPEPLLVVKPRINGDWDVKAVPVASQGFENRIQLPREWAGLSGQALADVTGVSDAVFCHNGRFMVIAKSREGALALAKKALEA